jgi:hypothetical protein
MDCMQLAMLPAQLQWHYVVKDSPHPHEPLELGFKNMNSLLKHTYQVSSCKDIVVGYRGSEGTHLILSDT